MKALETHSRDAVASSGKVVVLTAVWLALVAGLLEGIVRLVQSVEFGAIIGISPHIIWVAPMVKLLMLLALIIPLAILRPILRASWTRFSTIVLSTLAATSLIWLHQGMHKGVAILLSLGIAWRLSDRMLSPGFRRFARESIPWLATVAVFGGVVIAGTRRWQEYRAEPEMASAARGVNVLLIILDTVRGENMGVHGFKQPTTPYLARFAAEGARFDAAIATAPWTLASHGSMFTGRLPSELEARLRARMPAKFPVLAESFNKAKYRTGGFVANVAYCSREHGLERGFGRYEDFKLNLPGMLASTRLGNVLINMNKVRGVLGYRDIPGRKKADEVNAGFLKWLERGKGKPFFAFLNYFDAHQPYLPPEPYRSRFASRKDRKYRPYGVLTDFEQVSAEDRAWGEEHYNASIAYQDAAIEELMQELQRMGVLDQTLVIISSDHGEQFGEHHKLSHGNSLYRQVLHVPLIMRLPGKVPPGLVLGEPVSLGDLARTILDMAGLNGRGYPGRSLSRYWTTDSSSAINRPVISEMYAPGRSARSIIADGYHYIRWFQRAPEVYSFANDRAELRNLAKEPRGKAIIERLRRWDEEYTRIPNEEYTWRPNGEDRSGSGQYRNRH